MNNALTSSLEGAFTRVVGLIPRRSVSALRFLAALTLVVPALTATMPRVAHACSGVGVPPPADRFVTGSESVLPGPEGIALLGVVIDETELDVPFNAAYLSNVQTVLPLQGEGMGDVVRVGPNGFGAPDCTGGPRLFEGEKVMLFLYPSRGVLGAEGDPAQFGDWQSGQFGTPILFDGSNAYYLSWARFSVQGEGPSTEQRFYVGESAEVLRLALDYFGVTPEQRERAFDVVLGISAPPPGQSTGPSADSVGISPPDTGSAGLLDVAN